MQQKNIGTEKALKKIKHYCAYQERSHFEVKEKLYSFGLYKSEVESLLAQLIDENYLNEERFAIAYAGGKFRIKHWGRVKIRYELRQKKISEYCIKNALKNIDENEYEKILRALVRTKSSILKTEKNEYLKAQKIQAYLVNKGFERELIIKCMTDP